MKNQIKKYFSYIVLSITVCSSSIANATCDYKFCSSVVKLLYVTNNSSGNLFIQLDDDIRPLNCTPLGGKYLVLKRVGASFKEIYSLLLTASMLKKAITFRVVENSDCEIAYVTLDPRS